MNLDDILNQLNKDIENFEDDYYYLSVDGLLNYLKELEVKLQLLEQLN